MLVEILFTGVLLPLADRTQIMLYHNVRSPVSISIKAPRSSKLLSPSCPSLTNKTEANRLSMATAMRCFRCCASLVALKQLFS